MAPSYESAFRIGACYRVLPGLDSASETNNMFTSSEQAAGVHEMVFLVRLLHAEETFVCWALISARLASTALIYGAKSARALAEATLKKTGLGLSD